MKTRHKHSRAGKVDVTKLIVVVLVLLFWVVVIMNEEYVSECIFRHTAVVSNVCR
jgi:hypothetical protein